MHEHIAANLQRYCSSADFVRRVETETLILERDGTFPHKFCSVIDYDTQLYLTAFSHYSADVRTLL